MRQDILLLITFVLIFNGCTESRSRRAKQNHLHSIDAVGTIAADDKSMRWYKAANPEKINGVALVVHGLNLRPDKMEPIIAVLTDSGIDVLNLSLRGHGRNYSLEAGIDSTEARLEAFKTVSYQLWIDETHRAYHLARKRSAPQKLPLFFMGFSLGGLMGADLLASYPDVYFERMVLLAPALKMHTVNYVAKLLSPFPRLVIPSAASTVYRTNKGTPMAAYNSIFEAVKHFNKNVGPKINVPTVIMLDPRDEFIPYNGLKRFVENEQLSQWKFYQIQKDNSVKGRLHHLIIDEQSVGKKTWDEMRRVITNHLLPEFAQTILKRYKK